MLTTYHTIHDADGYEYAKRMDDEPDEERPSRAAKRHWDRETRYTVGVGARLPRDLWQRLKRYCDRTGYTQTELIIGGLEMMLALSEAQRGGKEG